MLFCYLKVFHSTKIFVLSIAMHILKRLEEEELMWSVGSVSDASVSKLSLSLDLEGKLPFRYQIMEKN